MLLICLAIPQLALPAESGINQGIKTLHRAPGELLFAVKDGADPGIVLQQSGLFSGNVQRIYPVEPAIKMFIASQRLQEDDIKGMDDEELFSQAYHLMLPDEQLLYRSYKLSLPEGMGVDEAIARLKAHAGVEYAQPNYIDVLYAEPDDHYYSSSNSWLQNFEDLWGIHKIESERAWALFESGGAPGYELAGDGVVVAVIDTGVDYNHPDLAENIYKDRDGNIIGYDFSDDDDDPLDYDGHGTHCAGSIAAVTNNASGVAGAAPKAKIMPVKIFPNAYEDVSINAIKWAVDNGAKVLSNSWGPKEPNPSRPSLEAAIDYAHNRGAVIVFAAGNADDDVANYSPANYSKTIAVAATDRGDQKASFSNYGDLIDVAAPGVEILSTRPTFKPMFGKKLKVTVITDNNEELSANPIKYSADISFSGFTEDILHVGGNHYGYPQDFTGQDFSGKIALIKRGEIPFWEKVRNAHNAGAIGVIIYNNQPGNFNGTLGEDHPSSIPAASLIQADGNYLVSEIGSQPTTVKMSAIDLGDNGVISGTSMACPHVSGLSALIYSREPGLTNRRVRQIIKETCDDIGNPLLGSGRINAYQAVSAVIPANMFDLIVESGTGSGSYAEGSVVTIVADGPEPGLRFSRWGGDIANVLNPESPTTAITMLADATVTAEYTENVIPGVEIIKVTTLQPEGPGSITEALATDGPRIIVFEVGGVIDLRGDYTAVRPKKDIDIKEPEVLIAGETAPDPGITIIGGGIRVRASDVAIRHLRIRVGDDPEGHPVRTAHAIAILSLDPNSSYETPIPAPISNIYIHHNSLSWVTDDIICTEYNMVSDLFVYDNLIAEGLYDEARYGSAEEDKHCGHAFLVCSKTRRLIVRDNLFAHTSKRNPWCSSEVDALIFNNLHFNIVKPYMSLATSQPDDAPSKLSVMENVSILGPDTLSWAPLFDVDDTSIAKPAKVYLKNNYLYEIGMSLFEYVPGYPGIDWNVSWKSESLDQSGERRFLNGDYRTRCALPAPDFDPEVNTVQTWTPLEELNMLEASGVPDRVLENVGARRWENNVHDQRVLQHTRNAISGNGDVGHTIMSHTDVGGFPNYAPAYRSYDPLTLLPVHEPIFNDEKHFLRIIAVNGDVSRDPDKTFYDPDEEVELTAHAHAGHTFQGWSGSITSSDNPVTVTMDSDKTITAEFLPNIYTITATSSGNGSIVPGGEVSVTHGFSQTFEMEPAADHMIKDVLVDGESVGSAGTYLFSCVDRDHTIHVEFVRAYTITASAGPGGSIVPSGDVLVEKGGSITFVITTAGAYRVSDIIVDGISRGAGSSFIFSDVDDNHTIRVEFLEIPHPVFGISDSCITDDWTGQSYRVNGDGDLNPGERIELYVDLTNSGTLDAINTRAVLSTSDQNITILNDSVDFSDIPIGQTRRSLTGFVMEADEDVQQGYTALLNLLITASDDYSQTDELQLPVLVPSGGSGTPGAADMRLDTNEPGIYGSQNHRISSDDKGNVYVAWEEWENGISIYFNHSQDYGSTWQTENITVNQCTGPDPPQAKRPAMCSDENGNVYVAWEDWRSANPDLYFNYSTNNGETWQPSDMRIDAAGSPGSRLKNVKLSCDNNGNIYAVWMDNRNGSSATYDAYFNYYRKGEATWQPSDIIISSYPPGSYSVGIPEISCDEKGHVYVVWWDDRHGDSDIYFTRLSDHGETWQASNIRLNTNAQGHSASKFPQISSNENGAVYVTWEDQRNGNRDVYLNYSLNHGVTWQTSDIRINTNDAGSSTSKFPRISCDERDNVYVTWHDDRNRDGDVYFNHSNNHGITWQPSDAKINTGSGSYTGYPAIDSGDNGIVCVSYASLRNGRSDIYFNYSDTHGATWQPGDMRLDTGDAPGANSSETPLVSYDNAGNAYIVWEDNRNNNANSYFDIFFNSVAFETYPQLYNIINQTVDEGSTLEFAVSGKDPGLSQLECFYDNRELSQQKKDNMSNAVLTFTGYDPATGETEHTFNWMPQAPASEGIYEPVYFVVRDAQAGMCDFQAISITVNDALAGYTLNTIAQNGRIDKDPDQGSYAPDTPVIVTAVAGAGRQFNCWKRDLRGNVNPTSITMDSDKTIEAAFNTTGNDNPVLGGIGDHSGVSTEPFRIIPVEAIDNPAEGETLEIYVLDAESDLPVSWSEIWSVDVSDPASIKGRVRWANPVAGVYTVTVRVKDQRGGEDSETITITIAEGNRPPVINPIGDQGGRSDETFFIAPIEVIDFDDDMIPYFRSDDFPVPWEDIWVKFVDEAGYLKGQVRWEDPIPGNYTVTFTAKDEHDAEHSEAITVTISP